MAQLRIVYDGEAAKNTLARNMARAKNRVLASMRLTAVRAADRIMELSVADVRSAGKYGPDWGVNANVSESGGRIRISVVPKIPYFSFFDTGGTIYGSPYLWIPLSSHPEIKHVWASQYPGQLVFVTNKKGQPLLLDVEQKQVMYTGHESVTIPKKFHTPEIVQKVAQELPQIYKESWASDVAYASEL